MYIGIGIFMGNHISRDKVTSIWISLNPVTVKPYWEELLLLSLLLHAGIILLKDMIYHLHHLFFLGILLLH